MVQLPYLQPFEGVNKRVSRIGANILLIKGNLCPMSFTDVPERSYVEVTLGVYERSCQRYPAITQNMVEPDPQKIKYRETLAQAIQQVVKGLKVHQPEVITQVANEHVKVSD